MATGDVRVFHSKATTVGGTTVVSAVDFAVQGNQEIQQDSSLPGEAGPGEIQLGDITCNVRLTGKDPSELSGFISATPADAVCTYKANAGADATVTVKSVVFHTMGEVTIPGSKGGSTGLFEIRGTCNVKAAGVTALWGGLITFG